MRLLLRNKGIITKALTRGKFYFSTDVNPPTEVLPSELEIEVDTEDNEETPVISTMRKGKNDFSKYSKNEQEETQEDFQKMVFEDDWQIASQYLTVEGYNYLDPQNRTELAKQKLRQYQQDLNPTFSQNFSVLLEDEKSVRINQTEVFMSKMNPFSPIYLKQGINFLTGGLLAKLIVNGELKMIKQFLREGAFEEVDFIEDDMIDEIVEQYFNDPRNDVLINILPYQKRLLDGQHSMAYKLAYKQLLKPQMQQILANLNSTNRINKLRVLWSFSKLYLYQANLSDQINHELGKIYFKVQTNQQEVRKESYIFLSSYSDAPFRAFLSTLFKQTNNFRVFFKSYALAQLLLSKLRAITKLLPQSQSNELHPVFQMIEFNLPKQSSKWLIGQILQLLSHQDHSRIQYQNFKRSYLYWQRDYTQPSKTIYHSHLSRLLEDNSEPLTLVYDGDGKLEDYACTTVLLHWGKIANENIKYQSQGEMIRKLIGRDYESVLNYFIATFSFSMDFATAEIFKEKLKKVDKTCKFNSKNQQAFYKLKIAHEVFLKDSFPTPLTQEKLDNPTKLNSTSAFVAYGGTIPNDAHLLNLVWTQKYIDFMQQQCDDLDEQHAALYPNGDQRQLIDDGIDQEELKLKIQQQQDQEAADPELKKRRQEFQQKVDYMMSELLELPLLEQNEGQEDLELNGNEIQNENQNENENENENMYENENENEQDQFQIQFEEQEHDSEDLIPVTEYQFMKKQSFFGKSKKQIPTDQASDAPERVQTNFNRRTNPADRKNFINRNNIRQFCTDNRPSQIIAKQNAFDFAHIEQYRRKNINSEFLKLMQTEQHIPQVGSGTIIAKYLFLQGKNDGSKFTPNPNKTLNIEFTSIIGTRVKDYGQYLTRSIYNFQLTNDFYEELLLDQLKHYNRFQFKQIIAHLVNFKEAITDPIIDVICKICEKERIGYTLVEIAHLFKSNGIRISSTALEKITNIWQKFDVINQDMLAFIRDYCKKMQIPLRTEFYKGFCRSLLKAGHFEKFQLVANVILTQIRPRPFRMDVNSAGLKPDQISVLEKEWKLKEQENYLRLYLELLEVIITNLDTTVPVYLCEMFEDYRKLRSNLNEKELGYAFVCNTLKREKIEQLLTILSSQQAKGTSFMYDCLLQTILSNFNALEDLSEKMLDTTVLKNRIVLNQQQIMKSLIVFKKSSSSNSFSKFLEHCLRFQEDIHKNNEIKNEMYYILNKNVDDVSVGGVFNLLDFIFNEKREKERVQYRIIKLSEQEKFRKLQLIQQTVTKTQEKVTVHAPVNDKKDKKKKKDKTSDQEMKQSKVEIKSQTNNTKQQSQNSQDKKESSNVPMTTKDQKKKQKKQKSADKQRKNILLEQIAAEQQSVQVDVKSTGFGQEEMMSLIKGQGMRHQSKKRKSLRSMSAIYDGAIEMQKEEEATRQKQAEKKAEALKLIQQGKGKGGKDKKGKGKDNKK